MSACVCLTPDGSETSLLFARFGRAGARRSLSREQQRELLPPVVDTAGRAAGEFVEKFLDGPVVPVAPSERYERTVPNAVLIAGVRQHVAEYLPEGVAVGDIWLLRLT